MAGKRREEIEEIVERRRREITREKAVEAGKVAEKLSDIEWAAIMALIQVDATVQVCTCSCNSGAGAGTSAAK